MNDTGNQETSTERTGERTGQIRDAFRLVDALAYGTDAADIERLARILNYNLDQLEKDIQAANALVSELWAQIED